MAEQKKEEEKRQTMRFSEAEFSLIRNTFYKQDPMLFTIRKFLMQGSLNKTDEQYLSQIRKSKELLRIIRKVVLPEFEFDAPLGQMLDLWTTVDLKDKDIELANMIMISREKFIAYFEQQLSVLETGKLPEVGTVPFIYADFIKRGAKDALDWYVDVTVRNMIFVHTNQRINDFFVWSNQSVESPLQKEVKKEKDGTK